MRRLFISALLPCLIAGCADDPRKSLAGAWAVASDTELSRETISLGFRKAGDNYNEETLIYLLQPNGLLTIERGRRHIDCGSDGPTTYLSEGRWQTMLSTEHQRRARRALARLRPKILSKSVPITFPKECGIGMHIRPWSSIAFSTREAGGLFIYQPQCDGLGAHEARLLLRYVVSTFPHTVEAKDFFEAP